MDALKLKKINFKAKEYVFLFKCPADIYPYVKQVFEGIWGMATDMQRKGSVARALSEGCARIDAQRRARDKKVKAEMKLLYAAAFKETWSEREALKAVTRKFKFYWWLRDEFKKEVERKRNLKIRELKLQGLKSRVIAEKVGVHPGTVRKILSHNSRNVK